MDGKSVASREHRLLDNIFGIPDDEFLQWRELMGIFLAEDAREIWNTNVAHVAKPEEVPGGTDIDRHVMFILHMSCLAEILNRATMGLIARMGGREMAAQFVEKAWIGKAVETLREEFPGIGVRVAFQNDNFEPGVPEVPPQ